MKLIYYIQENIKAFENNKFENIIPDSEFKKQILKLGLIKQNKINIKTIISKI